MSEANGREKRLVSRRAAENAKKAKTINNNTVPLCALAGLSEHSEWAREKPCFSRKGAENAKKAKTIT